jgi:hypothetical protein
MSKKRSAKLIMQQRKNFADAKAKIVDHVKENYIEPLKDDSAGPKEPRAKFGSGEGKVATFLGISPSQTEDRPEVQPVQGALDDHIRNAQANAPESLGLGRLGHFATGSTEHLATVTGMDEFKEKKANKQLTENNND